ncbi:hypothetical protein LWI29_027187 [Acer saccharum]|uniref:Uncharacterized protein n=1 Tax=Acer saccharum TaxID=4024 RepID=A0AA39T0H8_ACESA|nr:hypothetical protein LWI29_027187 [Acer saccharum]
MGVDAMKIGVQIRKFMVFLIRTCYRSVSNHPFLAGFVCFSMFLYRSFPFVFSLLVSASPILVCTAVLLGTLLSFGKPNVPEIEEKEEKVTTYEVASLKTGAVENDMVVERDENDNFGTVESFVGKSRDLVENSMDEVSLVENRLSQVEKDGGSIDCMPLIDQNSREMQFEKQVIEEVEREFNHLELQKEREFNHLELQKEKEFNHLELLKERKVHEEEPRIEGNLKNEEVAAFLSSKDADDDLGVEDDKSPGELIDTHKEDLLISWKRVGEDSDDDDDDEGDGDKSSDSGSDGAESSSPDASMADIIPMLDELHPLLDLEAAQPAVLSRNASDAASGSSHKSGEDSVESEDTDKQGEEGEGEDDNDDEEEEEGEGAKGGNEDESKSAIKWTEVDQKNLMDLGTLELERNQRLENLIARRRARKTMRLMAEKNLIDLESADFPFNVPPIATTRRNPFELPYDSYDDMVIPGSAPSILLPRRNPFDLPYDSNEEKPDLKEDSFQQEFSVFQNKEPLYRRNETFNIGTSGFGGPRQERLDFRWRPYFVPERMASEEGTSFSSFQRQLSELSESKVSSVPDTESVSSAVDEEDKKFHEQSAPEGTIYTAIQRQTSEISESKVSSIPDTESVSSAVDEEDVKFHEQSAPEGTIYTTIQRQISEISESKASSVPDTASVSSAADDEDKKLNEPDVSQETEVISNIDHVADLVKHGSQSSEDFDSLDIEQAEKRDVCHDEVEIPLGAVENHHELELSLSGTGGVSTPTELHTNEIHLTTEPGEDEFGSMSSLSSLSEADEKSPDMRKGGSASLEPKLNSTEETGISSRTSLEGSEFQFMTGVVEQKEPVYDSSPHAIEKFLSFTSISSETQLEIYEMASAQLQSTDKKSKSLFKDIEKNNSGFEDTCLASSGVCEVNGSVVEVDTVGSSGTRTVEEYTVYRGDRFRPELEQVGEKLDSQGLVYQNTSASSSVSAPEGQQRSVAVVEQEKDKEETRLEKDQGQSSSGVKNDSGLHEDMDVKMDSANSSNKDAPSEEKSPSKLEKQLSDKSMAEPCYDDHSESQEAPIIVTKSVEIVTENANVSEVHDHRDKTLKISSSMNSDSTSTTFGSPEYGSPDAEGVENEILDRILYEDRGLAGDYFNHSVEAYGLLDDKQRINLEDDEIKEIDEGLLSELDTVGDFSVTEVIKSVHTGLTPEATDPLSTELLPNESNVTKTNLELPDTEVKSIRDIDLAFKQLHEGAGVEEVFLPSMLEDQVVLDGPKDPVGINSHIPVVEARSLEDIHAALKQVSESNPGEVPKTVDSQDGSAKIEETEEVSAKQIESSSNLPEVPKPLESKDDTAQVEEKEVVTANDIEPLSVLAEVPEPLESRDGTAKVEEKEVVTANEIEPLIVLAEVLEPLESKDGNAEVEEVVAAKKIESSRNLADLPSKDGPTEVEEKVVSAKQIESSSNLTELPKLLESKDGATEVEEKEVDSAKQIESSSNLADLLKPLESKDGTTKVVEEEVIPAELPKPLESKDGVTEVAKQIESLSYLEDLPKALESKDGTAEVV